MSVYHVFASGSGIHIYTMQARNIQHASQFVRHWPTVTVRKATPNAHAAVDIHSLEWSIR